VNSVEAGAVIAVAVAGWPLYQLVTSGGMDATTALIRGGIVVVACGYGVSLIVRLASKFEADAEAQRARRLHELYSDMESAAASGTLVDQDASDDGAAGSEKPAEKSVGKASGTSSAS
jgi:hypothetical protein